MKKLIIVAKLIINNRNVKWKKKEEMAMDEGDKWLECHFLPLDGRINLWEWG